MGQFYIDHIALLVKDVEESEKSMPADLVRNQVERFEAEGTKEQYLTSDADHSGSILLMQPVGDGPYKRAMAKRGPGLHQYLHQGRKFVKIYCRNSQQWFFTSSIYS
jgi:hypothetical protein